MFSLTRHVIVIMTEIVLLHLFIKRNCSRESEKEISDLSYLIESQTLNCGISCKMSRR